MGDPIDWGFSIAQIIQAIKQGKELKDIKNDIADLRVDFNRLEQTVINRLPINATREQIVKATTDALLNTPIDAIFVGEDIKVTTEMPPKDMPPTTGGFFAPGE